MSEVYEAEVVEAEMLPPDEEKTPGFVIAPPSFVQEAIAGNALLEIKNSLDAAWLHVDETALPQDQSLCATHAIAVHFLERSLEELGEFSPESYTPSVRGWRVVAEKTLKDLQAMGKPDHTSLSDLAMVADIVTSYLSNGHKMLNQKTKQYERKKLATRLLAEMLCMDVKEPRRLESHGAQ
tara:strand:- start:1830 stop:2372 length:543 start_codon:yes stop_codon:yes gene_type:complete